MSRIILLMHTPCNRKISLKNRNIQIPIRSYHNVFCQLAKKEIHQTLTNKETLLYDNRISRIYYKKKAAPR